MNLFDHIHGFLTQVLKQLQSEGALSSEATFDKINVEPPRESSHGDMATNAAMVLAKGEKKSPLALADIITAALSHHEEASQWIQSCSVATPGFINMTLHPRVWQGQISHILKNDGHYGDVDLGKGTLVNVEFVSVNPTGPMHAGHARVAVFGDVLARLLEKAGYHVLREYYINDAGVQVRILAQSLYRRYLQALNLPTPPFEEGMYPGDYLIPVGEQIAQEVGDKWAQAPEDSWLPVFMEYGTQAMMEEIRSDLIALDVQHDVFTSEKALIDAGAVQKTIHRLEEEGVVYTGVLEPPKGLVPEDWEPRPQKLFKSTLFGDDVDRPLQKSNGDWTYFASDIAYHEDKIRRGAQILIDVWGADHIGYVKRTEASVRALSNGTVPVELPLCQMVNLMENGEALRMSKRAGTFVTLKDVVDSLGKDVVRFMMMTRKNDVSLDFDFAKVREQSKDNPVFYVNYAYARTCSVLRQANSQTPHLLRPAAEVDYTLLSDEAELDLLKKLAQWPRMVALSARLREPHRLAFFLYDVASVFHSLWNKGKDEALLRFILPDQPEVTSARLLLVQAVQSVILEGLTLFGVNALEEMH